MLRVPSKPQDRCVLAHLETHDGLIRSRRNLSVRLARLLAGQRSFPKVQRIGSRHPCWPPNPAWTLNQIGPDLGIPIPSKRDVL
jgi:hypothetical protein